MKLPTILSGPILRKVNQSSVYIWIATNSHLKLDGILYRIQEEEATSYSYELLSNKSVTTTVQLGEQLFIHLIKIVPMEVAFPSNQLLGYNLHFHDGSKQYDLNSFGLLSENDPNSITYGKLPFPSFFINRSDNSHILYGSCRKFHGKGEDALVSGDLLIKECYHDLTSRPHSLFLLGDQIYADDVADPLFPIIHSLSHPLIGTEEKLEKLDPRLKTAPFSTSIHQINGRQFISEHFCSFTSSHAENHLFTFGEYAVMYLLSFSPALWEFIQENDLYPTFKDELERNNIHFVFNDCDHYKKEREKEQKMLAARFQEQWEEIQPSISNFTSIRRLLANTPTYMIFDDHDITDDWNLSEEWKKNVSNSPLGRHVVTNGLTAYWAFQGFGNCPENFDSHFIRTITRYMKDMEMGSTGHKSWLELFANFQSWHFVAPTMPKTLFLDTRTQREFDISPKPVKFGRVIEEQLYGPILIQDSAWHDLTKSLVQSGWKQGDALMVASPTPLYGVGLIESVLNSYVYPMRALGIPVEQALDYEAWKFNGKGFHKFLEHIAMWNPSTCTILSGDVHYASSLMTTVQSNSGNTSTIFQFTSSPMKNMSFSGLWGAVMKSAIWINTLKRKKKSIYRICMEDYEMLLQTKQPASPIPYYWKETINYLSTSKGSIIDTKNNLGYLSYSKEQIQNHLLHSHHFEKEETTFEAVPIQ